MPPKPSPSSGRPSKESEQAKREQQRQQSPRSSETSGAGRKRKEAAAGADPSPSNPFFSQGAMSRPSPSRPAVGTRSRAAKGRPSRANPLHRRAADATGLLSAERLGLDSEMPSSSDDPRNNPASLEILCHLLEETDLEVISLAEPTEPEVFNLAEPVTMDWSDITPPTLDQSYPDYRGCMRSQWKPSEAEMQGMKRQGYRLIYERLTNVRGEEYCPGMWWIWVKDHRADGDMGRKKRPRSGD